MEEADYIDELDTATKQAVNDRDEHGRFAPGNVPKAGFHTNPERRSNGNWKREDTARYKLEQMMQLTDSELQAIVDNPKSPTFEKHLAEAILTSQWQQLDQMMNQVYGRKSDVDMHVDDKDGVPLIKGFVIPTLPEGFIDKSIRAQLSEEEANEILGTGSSNTFS